MKLTRREREKLRKNQEIIEASIKVFSEKGFYEAKMQDIAKVVEMGVGTIYQYFKSKDDLYYNAILYKLNEFHQFYSDRLKEDCTFVEGISIIIKAWIEYFTSNKEFFGIVFSEWTNVKKTVATKVKKRFVSDFMEKGDEIKGLIEKSKQTGEIKPEIDTEILNSMIFGAIQYIIHRGTVHKLTLTPSDVAEGIVGIILPGILNVKRGDV